MLNNVESGWNEFMTEERSLDEYIEKFNLRLTKEQILGDVRDIMMKSYIADIGSQMHCKAT